MKQLILNAFEMASPGHQTPGLWKHPDDQSRRYNDIEYWTNLAKLLEKGKFNAVFIADTLGGYDVYKKSLDAAAKSGTQWPINEPSLAVSAMAAVTKNLSFAVTFSTISENPYHFARRLATLDHLTKGRVGWNVVSSYLESAANNLLNGAPLPPHDERYDLTQEYIEVVYELLLSSWADDALVLDKENNIFLDPSKIRKIHHSGKYFTVPGPAITEPTPQRFPVVLQAGMSTKGVEFAAKNAEVMFVDGATPEDLKATIDKQKKAVENQGRDPSQVKFLQLIAIVLGETQEQAVEKFREIKNLSDPEGAQALFGGWTGVDLDQYGWDQELTHVESNAVRGILLKYTKSGENVRTREYLANTISVGGLGPVFIGTASTVADEIERWADVSGVDGFNIAYTITPGSFEDVVEYLVPELRKRGRVWDDYPKQGLTFREQLFGLLDDPFLHESHPAHKLRWRAGESKEEFEARISRKRKLQQ